MTKHFINLTNGIEQIPNLIQNGIPLDTLNYTYIASTTIENKAWIKLIMDLDHNLLLNLAIGNECIIYDFGTHRKLSKTIYYAVPLIRYILTRFWLDNNDMELCYRMTRNSYQRLPEKEHFQKIYEYLFIHNNTKEKTALKDKLKKYKNKFLLTNEIRLIGISESTSHDGDYDYYKNTLKTVYDIS